MTEYPYILFNQTPEQLRRIGSCGGKAQARNRRARRTALAPPPPPRAPAGAPVETTTAAMATLDAQFPWLSGVERRCRNGA